MPIVKSNQTVGFAKDAVVLDLGDIGRQAARIRMAAEGKAGQIVTDAERQAQKLIEQAEGIGFEKGQAEGFEQGLKEGREKGHVEALTQTQDQLAQLQAAWSDVAEQLEGQRREMDREARQSVLAFALKMAERLVLRVIEVDETVVVDQVAQALSLVTRPMDVSVRISPADRGVLAEAMPQLMEEFNQFEHVHLRDDASVGRGGCIVSYGQGVIDATIEKQIERVMDVILPPPPEASQPPEVSHAELDEPFNQGDDDLSKPDNENNVN